MEESHEPGNHLYPVECVECSCCGHERRFSLEYVHLTLSLFLGHFSLNGCHLIREESTQTLVTLDIAAEQCRLTQTRCSRIPSSLFSTGEEFALRTNSSQAPCTHKALYMHNIWSRNPTRMDSKVEVLQEGL